MVVMKLIKVDSKDPRIEDIFLAADIVKKGGVVAFPTETVYGLGADALDPIAVARIFEIKKRPSFDPVIVHIDSIAAIDEISSSFNRRAEILAEAFWPGPLTMVLPKSEIIPGIVTSGLDTVAVRMPSHPVARELIKATGGPIAAPSANPFGYISPTTAEHVIDQIGSEVDLILDGGSCPVGVESTVLDLSGDEVTLLRPGGLSLEEIESMVGDVKTQIIESEKQHSPGQLPSHYAPRTPVRILEEDSFKPVSSEKAGLLAFTSPEEDLSQYQQVEVLSSIGNLCEAAANLFSSLHRLDSAGLDVIYVRALPEVGLGRAIMDRLNRAAGTKKK